MEPVLTSESLTPTDETDYGKRSSSPIQSTSCSILTSSLMEMDLTFSSSGRLDGAEGQTSTSIKRGQPRQEIESFLNSVSTLYTGTSSSGLLGDFSGLPSLKPSTLGTCALGTSLDYLQPLILALLEFMGPVYMVPGVHEALLGSTSPLPSKNIQNIPQNIPQSPGSGGGV